MSDLKKIAQRAFPNGCDLKCKECGCEYRAAMIECSVYLADGWPTCCGKTMQATLPKEGE